MNNTPKMNQEKTESTQEEFKRTLDTACSRIAPLWSLENVVAVNPYLGFSEMQFSEAMEFLNKSSKVEATLPKAFYLEALEKGLMTREDILLALESSQAGAGTVVDDFIEELYTEDLFVEEQKSVQTYADMASELRNKKWNRFMVDRISFWASAYFDDYQASWKTAKSDVSIFQDWKREAELDYSSDAMGLAGFRTILKGLPADPIQASLRALAKLQIPAEAHDLYLNSLLMKMNGWAGCMARIDWEARLDGRKSHATREFLAIMLVWEMCLVGLSNSKDLSDAWEEAKQEMQELQHGYRKDERFLQKIILQSAFDIANQRQMIQKINKNTDLTAVSAEPKAQAVFCIDVRSEVFRRNLEAANEAIETFGFAGFFAFPIKYVRLAHEEGTNQCPVLLTTSHTVHEKLGDPEQENQVVERRKLKEHFHKVWKSFKSGAVTCFSFVSPLGIYYIFKLLTDAFSITRPVPHPEQDALTANEIEGLGVRIDGEDLNGQVQGIPLQERITMATSTLKAMSLSESFAPFVLLVGHGSSSVNNPHATGLDCGACGGHSGEANAKVAAAVLNDREVRMALPAQGIEIPEKTVFLAGLHDTTTDEVKLYQSSADLNQEQRKALDELQLSLKLAGEASRKERGERMQVSGEGADQKVLQRSKDWSQVRPELGLAGCSFFIVAPRERTRHLNLEGKSFLHNYSWKKDEGFGILELIMTAPMVVTSWINLQYYASTVDNKKFGAGNKTLHNIVGGMGVLEGFGGDLRTGLPWQSIHDGTKFQHEPQRLNVIIEAPIEELNNILAKHESIRQLCDNNWIHLFAMNGEGKVAQQYVGKSNWAVL